MKWQYILFLLLSMSLITGCSSVKDLPAEEEAAYSEAELATDSNVYGPAHPQYEIRAIYSEEEQQVTGELRVTFQNNLEMEMEDVYFNLWPNSEVSEDGSMEIHDVSMEDSRLSY